MKSYLNKNLIVLIDKKNNINIHLYRDKVYNLEEFNNIFKSKENVIFIDYEKDEIEITDEEDLSYFFTNLDYVNYNLNINNITYKILKKKPEIENNNDIKFQWISGKKLINRKVFTCLNKKKKKITNTLQL